MHAPAADMSHNIYVSPNAVPQILGVRIHVPVYMSSFKFRVSDVRDHSVRLIVCLLDKDSNGDLAWHDIEASDVKFQPILIDEFEFDFGYVRIFIYSKNTAEE